MSTKRMHVRARGRVQGVFFRAEACSRAESLGLGAHTAAAISFVVSAANNYWWNRHWTFAHQKGHFALQGVRFFVVSATALAVNQIWLFVFLDWFGWGKIVSQAIAIILVTPLNFIGNKLWSFRVRR